MTEGMVAKQTKQDPEQKRIVGRVMHEVKEGKLEFTGGKVRNPRQAIAIGLSEAGASNRDSPKRNRHNLDRTRSQGGSPGAGGGETRRELYAKAAAQNIPGRSKMSKAELQQAVRQ